MPAKAASAPATVSASDAARAGQAGAPGSQAEALALQAEALIRGVGARLTASRSAVLALLLAADHAMTHQEITDALAAALPVDRVTVYRVLEWLVEEGLAHRIAQDDRVWRFSVSRAGASRHAAAKHDHQHAHFSCKQCGQTFCLDGVPAKVSVKLPAGYRSDEVELTIRGVCEHCR